MQEIEKFFEGRPLARQLFEEVRVIIETIGSVEIKTTKSQIAFRRNRGFAWVWIPGHYLHREAAPLVLSIALRRRDPSPKWKEVVEPHPGRFMHHMELYTVAEVDGEVSSLLKEAWDLAG